MKRIGDFNSQLNVISSIRLPLILLIVSCHVIPEVTSGTFDWWIVKFIGHEVASIGVVRHSGITCMTVAFIINILGTVLLCIIGYIVTMKCLPVWMQKALMGGRIR